MVMIPSNYNRDADYERTVNEAVAMWETETKGMPRQDICMGFVKRNAEAILYDLGKMKAEGAPLTSIRKIAEASVIHLNVIALDFCSNVNNSELCAISRQISEVKSKIFDFPGKDELRQCLEEDPAIKGYGYLKEKVISREIAEIFAGAEKTDDGIELVVDCALEAIEKDLKSTPGRLTSMQSAFSDALRRCATEKPAG